MCKKKIEVDREEYFTPVVPQDRALAAAVLGRAFWDLDYLSHDRDTVSSAVRWFEDEEQSKYPFTFTNIKSLLDVFEREGSVVVIAIREAKEYLEASYGNRKLNKRAFAKKMKHTHCFRQKVGTMGYG